MASDEADGERSQSKVFCGMSKVKFDFSTVLTRVIPILKRIEVGEYPAKIGRVYGWSRQHVSYYVDKLQRAGLIRRQERSSAVFYELTGRGEAFLGSCEGLLLGSGVFRLHKCQIKYEVLAEGLLPKDFRRVEMTNWTALLGLEQGVKVRRTSCSWIVHVETLYGKSPAELGALAKSLADRVAASLCLKYGCRLGEGKFCKGYEIAVDDPVARFLSRYFTVSTPDRKMDHSPGELEGEVDYLSRDAAVEYLMMPERVKKMEGQIEVMQQQLTEVSELFTRVLNGVSSQKSESEVKLRSREDVGYMV